MAERENLACDYDASSQEAGCAGSEDLQSQVRAGDLGGHQNHGKGDQTEPWTRTDKGATSQESDVSGGGGAVEQLQRPRQPLQSPQQIVDFASWPEIINSENLFESSTHEEKCKERKWKCQHAYVLKNWNEFTHINDEYCIHTKCNQIISNGLKDFEGQMTTELSNIFRNLNSRGIFAEKIFHQVIQQNCFASHTKNLNYKRKYYCSECHHKMSSFSQYRRHCVSKKCAEKCSKKLGQLKCRVRCKIHQNLHFQQIPTDKSVKLGEYLSLKFKKLLWSLNRHDSTDKLSNNFFVIREISTLYQIINFCQKKTPLFLCKFCKCEPNKNCKCAIQHLLNFSCFMDENPPCQAKASEQIISQFYKTIKMPNEKIIFLTYFNDSFPREIFRNALRVNKKITYLFIVNQRLVEKNLAWNKLQNRSYIRLDFVPERSESQHN